MAEKKWFIYLTDHHEGPFSEDELQASLSRGQITSASYIWAEGMPDWVMLSQVEALRGLNTAPTAPNEDRDAVARINPSAENAPAESTTAPDAVSILEDSPPDEPSLSYPVLEERHPQRALESAAPFANHPTSGPAPGPVTELARATLEMPTAAPESLQQSHAPAPKRRRARGGWSVAIFFILLGGLIIAGSKGLLDPILNPAMKTPTARAALDTIRAALTPVGNRVPWLGSAIGKLISPIPPLDDVKPEEFAELKNAAGADLARVGAKAALALSKADLAVPKIYVATNLPDDTQFDLQLVGIPDTLLGQLSFSAKFSISASHKLGTSAPLRASNGSPLPRGQYILYVTEAEAQPAVVKAMLERLPLVTENLPARITRGVRVFASKGYFLGGANDSVYTSRLKEFHDKLRDKAAAELADLNQFATTLQGQLDLGIAEYKRLSAGKLTPKKKGDWKKFFAKWNPLNEKISEDVRKWTPENIENDLFYGSLFHQLQDAEAAAERLYAFYGDYFAGQIPKEAKEVKGGETTSQAEAAMSGFQAKLEQARKMTPTPNGMPQREGL